MFIASMEQIFKKLNLQDRGINIDTEKVTDLGFADDVALITSLVKDMELQLNDMNKRKQKDWTQDSQRKKQNI